MLDHITAYLAGFIVVLLALMALVSLSMAMQCNTRVTATSYHKGMIVVPTRKQWSV